MSSSQLYKNWTEYEDQPMGIDEVSAGTGPLTSNDRVPASSDYTPMVKGATSAMNSGSSLGGVLTGAGMSGFIAGSTGIAAPAALGAGLALSFYEQQQQADAANEKAKAEEAQNRKQSTQNAINSLIGVTQHLGV